MTYNEKLKDPRWQKKRLQIMERDGFSCQLCMNTKDMLVVHHKNYLDGNNPWDYPDNFLITLCNSCHEKFHDVPEHIDKWLDIDPSRRIKYFEENKSKYPYDGGGSILRDGGFQLWPDGSYVYHGDEDYPFSSENI